MGIDRHVVAGRTLVLATGGVALALGGEAAQARASAPRPPQRRSGGPPVQGKESHLMEISARFNGPADSAHGGHACGLVASFLGGGPARVSLRSPPPLARKLEVVRTGRGVELRDGERLVAEGVTADLDLEVTEPIDPVRAAEASRAGYGRWSAEHPFPTCFGCGPAREAGDGLRLFPGPLGDGRFAAPWTPYPSMADNGIVRSEVVWAALDCPTGAPGYLAIDKYGGPFAVLAQLHARIDGPITAGSPHVIVSWPLGVEGRKRTSRLRDL